MALHLILGGTGMVGGEVMRRLLARGERVRVLTRSAEKANSLPTGATGVVGHLMEPSTYETTFQGADTVFLLNAVSPTELHEGIVAVNEARRFGVKRVVYLSVHQVDAGPDLPHFAAKIAVETALRASGVPHTILRPNNFYQNDHWYRDALVQYGVYPQPIGDVGLSRVDVRDIAEAAANALMLSGHEGKTYALVGPKVWTGTESAAQWGRALGREVRYGGDDLQAWGEQALRMLPAPLVYDFGLMYAMFQRRGLRASASDLAETQAIVGAMPRPYEDFTRELAAQWGAAVRA